MNRLNNLDAQKRKESNGKNNIEEELSKKNIKIVPKKEHSNKKKKSKNKVKKSHPILRLVWNFFLILLVLIVLTVFLLYHKTIENGGGIQGFLCTVFGQSVDDLKNLKPITFLLLGISNDIDKELSDTIIVCNYDPTNDSITLISIPRDTFVGKNESNAKGSDKINSLYSRDIQNTLKAVNKITGLNIKNYVVVKNSALIDIVNTLGGVWFDVPIDMDYDDPTQDLHIHLKKGYQKLNGSEAEGLLRFRHNNNMTSYPAEYGDNDFGRMKTQRNFIETTIKQSLEIRNLLKIGFVYNSVMKNLDTNITKETIFSYMPKIANLDTQNINSLQIPGESKKINNLWFFIPYEKQTLKLTKENIK